MASHAVIRLDDGDSQSIAQVANSAGFGLVSRYASRLASTTAVRAVEKERVKTAQPIKFGRLVRTPDTSKRAPERKSSPRTRPVPPLHVLHVIAGQSAQPEPA